MWVCLFGVPDLSLAHHIGACGALNSKSRVSDLCTHKHHTCTRTQSAERLTSKVSGGFRWVMHFGRARAAYSWSVCALLRKFDGCAPDGPARISTLLFPGVQQHPANEATVRVRVCAADGVKSSHSWRVYS